MAREMVPKADEADELDDSWFRSAPPELERLRSRHASATRQPSGEDELGESWFV
ncbi:MAG: hypothetical protein HY744_28985 [Deltaproteobacteria bacterium]|nr:hypothetical protein [Deltaproteobacteria bacterium]